jgi:cytochrome c-type biogenesis protein CcmF
MLGSIGHLLILTAFVSCGLSAYAFFRYAQQPVEGERWRQIGRFAWGIQTATVAAAGMILSYLIMTHQFQYAYVYQYSSLDLPKHYLFATLWAGQEGSFWLWILFNALLGVTLTWWARSYEGPVMAVVAVCQIFLLSMIVGLHVGSIPIGSSPFTMLYERFPDAPIFRMAGPSFVPADGGGLNDLLQNPWMVIHPPMLFVGFASMLVPFSFAVAALWKRRYTDWVRPALPWTLFAVLTLGVGIAMGGYWAYITLSFGGYWAWDPVENSSLVPWMLGIAAVHTMIVQKRSGHSHKASLILCILAYMFVIYSTFLTRSGILGDISVHSFVDLGMSNQLLVWIFAMGVIGFGLFAARFRELPGPGKEPSMASREFMIFCGAMLLCAAAAVIILGTSAPIFGRIFRDNPSGVPLAFYNKWTLPLAIGFTLLAGIGQLMWWNKMQIENLNRVLLRPLGLSVASTIAILAFTPFVQYSMDVDAVVRLRESAQAMNEMNLVGTLGAFWDIYGMGLMLLVLMFAGLFAFFGNSMVMWKVGKGNLKMVGGAVSHVGFALVILGIVASSGFSQPLGRQSQVALLGGAYNAPEETRDNFVIMLNQTKNVSGYQVTYRGQELNEQGHTAYILDFVDRSGRSFTMRPEVYKNNKDQWIQHPDLRIYFEKDLYVAVTPSVMFDVAEDTGEPALITLTRNDSTVLGDQEFAIHFIGFDTDVDPSILPEDAEIAVAAMLNVTHLASGETRLLRPVMVITTDHQQLFLKNGARDWDFYITLSGIDVNAHAAQLAVEGVQSVPEDWIVVQAYEKPFINLLWIGLFILSFGFGISIFRRVKDQRQSMKRGAA